VDLLKEGINEVIATTRFNAAPMGIINRRGRLALVLFKGSDTQHNVVAEEWIVANFIFDPVIYVQTAFEDLPADAFVEEVVEGITMHRLKNVEAWAAYRAEIASESSESMVVTLTPLKQSLGEVGLRPVNRGFNAIIEATVHATRYVRTRDPWLRQLIDHHAGLARKCGGEREWEALEKLMGYIEKYEVLSSDADTD
jgi:hypothetical protein